MLPTEVGKKPEGQILPKETELVITLKINAAGLYIERDPSSEVLNTFCELADSNPMTPKKTLVEHFVSWVSPGQQVRWEAKRSDSGGDFDVAIESIIYADDKENVHDEAMKEDFFNAKAVDSSDGKIVRAKVKDIEKPGEFVHFYDLKFIVRNGKDARSYIIDPRLKIEQ